MSPGAEANTFVGINWGSTNFRAFLISAEGRAIDEYSAPAGIAGLDRDGMAAMMDGLISRWPRNELVYASGMIGSNVGWIEVPYVSAPATRTDLAMATVATQIGKVSAHIVPGVACRRDFDGEPDILRGEEIELLGLAAMRATDGWVALPGTHTKWVRLKNGQVLDFFTSMSGEIFDRLTGKGLLAAVVAGDATDGLPFLAGVTAGEKRRLSLGTLLFGARAKVMRGLLAKSDAASYIRGLLIGSEIGDALAVYPTLMDSLIPLVGSAPLCKLYATALGAVGISTELIESRVACVRGFHVLHRARHG